MVEQRHMKFPPHARGGWTLRRRLGCQRVHVSPARAGMDRCEQACRHEVFRFPRTRGDGPEEGDFAHHHFPFPPHARGWTIERRKATHFLIWFRIRKKRPALNLHQIRTLSQWDSRQRRACRTKRSVGPNLGVQGLWQICQQKTSPSGHHGVIPSCPVGDRGQYRIKDVVHRAVPEKPAEISRMTTITPGGAGFNTPSCS